MIADTIAVSSPGTIQYILPPLAASKVAPPTMMQTGPELGAGHAHREHRSAHVQRGPRRAHVYVPKHQHHRDPDREGFDGRAADLLARHQQEDGDDEHRREQDEHLDRGATRPSPLMTWPRLIDKATNSRPVKAAAALAVVESTSPQFAVEYASIGAES